MGPTGEEEPHEGRPQIPAAGRNAKPEPGISRRGGTRARRARPCETSKPSVGVAAAGIGGSRSRLAAPATPALAAEPGCDHGDLDLVAERLVDHGAEDDVGVLVRGPGDDLGGLVDLEEADVGAAGDVEQNPGRPFDRRLEERRRDGRRARLRPLGSRPMRAPMPISAEPASRMIVRTSAKSRLTRPGSVIRSVIPCTPCRRMSSAIRNASTTEVCRSTTWSSRSFSITINVSTRSRSWSMPRSA